MLNVPQLHQGGVGVRVIGVNRPDMLETLPPPRGVRCWRPGAIDITVVKAPAWRCAVT